MAYGMVQDFYADHTWGSHPNERAKFEASLTRRILFCILCERERAASRIESTYTGTDATLRAFVRNAAAAIRSGEPAP